MSKIQAILFDRKYWSVDDAEDEFFNKMNLTLPKGKKIHLTKNKIRFRVLTPNYDKFYYITKVLSKKDHISSIVQFPKKIKGSGSVFSDLFSIKHDYNKISRETLTKYGDILITRLEVRRHPLSSVLHKLLKFVTLGKNLKYDTFFHLSLIATLANGKRIIIEKLETINISPNFESSNEDVYLNVPLNKKNLTINNLVTDGRKYAGEDKWWSYNAFFNNCQYLIKYILIPASLYDNVIDKFVFQDLKLLIEHTPSFAKFLVNAATTTAAVINKYIAGKSGVPKKPNKHWTAKVKDIMLRDNITWQEAKKDWEVNKKNHMPKKETENMDNVDSLNKRADEVSKKIKEIRKKIDFEENINEPYGKLVEKLKKEEEELYNEWDLISQHANMLNENEKKYLNDRIMRHLELQDIQPLIKQVQRLKHKMKLLLNEGVTRRNKDYKNYDRQLKELNDKLNSYHKNYYGYVNLSNQKLEFDLYGTGVK